MLPQTARADEVENPRRIQRNNDPWVICPGGRGAERGNCVAMRGSRPRRHQQQRDGDQECHRRHGSNNIAAIPCMRMTIANRIPEATPIPESRWLGWPSRSGRGMFGPSYRRHASHDDSVPARLKAASEAAIAGKGFKLWLQAQLTKA